MKKTLTLTLACALALTGCGTPAASGAADATASPAPAAQSTPATAESTAVEPKPAESAAPEGAAGYTWAVEPTIEAEDIQPLVLMRGDDELDELGKDFNAYGMTLDEDVFSIEQNGKYGLIDTKGRLLLPCAYDSLIVGYDDTILAWNVDTTGGSEDAYFVIDEEDGVYTPRSIESSQVPAAQGTAPNPGLYWVPELNAIYHNSVGDSYLTTPYVGRQPVAACYAAKLEKDGDSQFVSEEDGYVLTDGAKPVSDEHYDNVGCYSCGLFPVARDGKVGYLDAAGKVVIPLEYGMSFHMGYGVGVGNVTYGTVVLRQGGENTQYALYDTAGQPIIPFGDFEGLSAVYEDELWAKKDGKWGVLRLAKRYAEEQTGRDD